MNNIKLKCKRCGFPIQGTVYSVDGFEPYCYECNFYLRNCSHSSSSIAHEEAYDLLTALLNDDCPSDRAKGKVKSDGGSTDYYRLPEHATELRHLISHKGMRKSRGDLFKACYRLGEKDGADLLYDLNKIKFFAEDLIEMYERGDKV